MSKHYFWMCQLKRSIWQEISLMLMYESIAYHCHIKLYLRRWNSEIRSTIVPTFRIGLFCFLSGNMKLDSSSVLFTSHTHYYIQFIVPFHFSNLSYFFLAYRLVHIIVYIPLVSHYLGFLFQYLANINISGVTQDSRES